MVLTQTVTLGKGPSEDLKRLWRNCLCKRSKGEAKLFLLAGIRNHQMLARDLVLITAQYCLEKPAARISQSDLEVSEQGVLLGSFGEVRRAVHRRTGNSYALKTVHLGQKAAYDARGTRHFIRAELERMQYAGRPPSIVGPIEAFYSRTKATVTFLMDWMKYGSVRQCVAQLRESKGVNMPERDVALITSATLHALRSMRQPPAALSPDHLLIDHCGKLRVVDFDGRPSAPSGRSVSPTTVAPPTRPLQALGAIVAALTEPVRPEAAAASEPEGATSGAAAPAQDFVKQATRLSKYSVRPAAERLCSHSFVRGIAPDGRVSFIDMINPVCSTA